MVPQLRGGHKRDRLGVGELAGKAILLRAILPRFSVGQSPQWTHPSNFIYQAHSTTPIERTASVLLSRLQCKHGC